MIPEPVNYTKGTVHVLTSALNGEDPESVVLRSKFMANDHNVQEW